VVVCVTRYASLTVRIGALAGAVIPCAIAAFVDRGGAFVRVMIPSLTFEASCWLFLDRFSPDLLVTDVEAVSQGPVGREWISKRNEEVCGFLLRGSSCDGFHPTDRGDYFRLYVVRIADLLSMGFVFYVNCEGDVEGDDGV
jgi:hypothetical protein